MWLDTIIKILQSSLPFYAFLGASTLYLLNRLQKKQPFSVLTALNVDMVNNPLPAKVLADVFISGGLGALIVVALTSPATIPQAVIAGLGMTGILTIHTTEIKP